MNVDCTSKLCSSSFLNASCSYGVRLLYFLGYKMGVFPFQTNPKNLDPSYKMDLDIWDCFGRKDFVLKQNFVGLI